MKKTIGIIGAGISGLVTAKTLQEHGFNVKVFEKEAEIGGVWASVHRYPGIITQNPKDTYAFTDFPMPKDYPDWPSGQQVQQYLMAYSEHFNLTPHIHLQTNVIQASPTKNNTWRIETEQMNGQAVQLIKEELDGLVICNGVHNYPNMPQHKGQEVFKNQGGQIYHSSQFHDLQEVKNKKVIVVGFSKSACDLATQAATIAKQTHLVFRKTYWKIPYRFFGVLSYQYLLLNRLGESLFPYPQQDGIEKFLHGKGKPILHMMWASLKHVVSRHSNLKQTGLTPEHPIKFIGGPRLGLETNGFVKKVVDKTILTHKAEISHYEAHQVQLTTGETVDADVVIYATGWKQQVSFLPTEVIAKCQDEQGRFFLYRHILPIDLPNLCFVGYNSSLCSPFTSELAAHWTAQYFKGELTLPSKKEMKTVWTAYIHWLSTWNPTCDANKGTCIIPFTFHHADNLMRDMGLSPKRANAFKEWLLPFDPSRYKGLTKELKALQSITKIDK